MRLRNDCLTTKNTFKKVVKKLKLKLATQYSMPVPSGDRKIHKRLSLLATVADVDDDHVVGLIGDVES